MMYKPIQIKDLSLFFPHKTCFENFNCQIPYGSRIAIIGRNGSGKSTLLKMIASICVEDVVVGYVPQVIVDHTDLSGGQRLNKAVTEALSLDPNVLLLDEPTNHLDSRNKKSLMRMLQNYLGTLIIVSHDKKLLCQCTDLWHIEHGKIHIFSGNYDDYIREIRKARSSLEQEITRLDRQKKDMHHKLMFEQQRAAKRKVYGEKKYADEKLALRWAQATGENTTSKNKANIKTAKHKLLEQLTGLYLPEIIVPKFSLNSADIGDRTIVSISDGKVAYAEQEPLLQQISLSISSRERIAIQGDNASGKSTLIKAIIDDACVIKSGNWYAPKISDIGYLDQHYGTLYSDKTVLETIADLVPHLPHTEIRRHLNDFLFRKNEEVNALVSTLSGGEKARLSLAQIAAKTPKILILDEITNNLDLETKDHVIQVLKSYPGAMIVISHDADFLEEIGVNSYFKIIDGYVSFNAR
jgi:ATPase subunit of ABC transporter with duplicated ATPase domains